ncbi:MAG: carbohydrate kinase [Acidimicrobiales bacterium]
MIVSCGEALVDLLPEPVPGGGPMNVAVAAARLGAPTAFLGRISTDDHGESILEHLQANGVDVRACERGPEPTALARVEHVPQTVFHFEGSDTADMNLRRAELSGLGAGGVLLHGGALGLFRGRTAVTLAELAERHQGTVSLDPNVRPAIIDDRARWWDFHRRWVENAHVYKASDEDLAWIWPGRTASACADELLAGTAEVVFVTHGAGGVTVYTPGGEAVVAGREVDVVDTVGAGDTFVAAVLVALCERGLAGDPDGLGGLALDVWAAIARRGVEVASVTCTRAGADPPTLDDLAQLLPGPRRSRAVRDGRGPVRRGSAAAWVRPPTHPGRERARCTS